MKILSYEVWVESIRIQHPGVRSNLLGEIPDRRDIISDGEAASLTGHREKPRVQARGFKYCLGRGVDALFPAMLVPRRRGVSQRAAGRSDSKSKIPTWTSGRHPRQGKKQHGFRGSPPNPSRKKFPIVPTLRIIALKIEVGPEAESSDSLDSYVI